MNIKPYDKTVRDLLGSKRQFVIPRFQREYSWDKKNYQEFLEDMLGNLIIKDGRVSSSQYFLGTMLFIGNFAEGTEQENIHMFPLYSVLLPLLHLGTSFFLYPE